MVSSAPEFPSARLTADPGETPGVVVFGDQAGHRRAEHVDEAPVARDACEEAVVERRQALRGLLPVQVVGSVDVDVVAHEPERGQVGRPEAEGGQVLPDVVERDVRSGPAGAPREEPVQPGDDPRGAGERVDVDDAFGSQRPREIGSGDRLLAGRRCDEAVGGPAVERREALPLGRGLGGSLLRRAGGAGDAGDSQEPRCDDGESHSERGHGLQATRYANHCDSLPRPAGARTAARRRSNKTRRPAGTPRFPADRT